MPTSPSSSCSRWSSPASQHDDRTSNWRGPGTSAWHFVSLPEELADLIAASSTGRERRFGSVPVEVTVGDLTWRTSVFPDKKSGTLLLPLKKQVRQHLGCAVGDTLQIEIQPTGL